MDVRAKITAAAVAVTLTACASVPANYAPIIDTKDADLSKYTQDLGECRAFAAQIDREAATANAAIAGAIFMGVLSAALGGHTRDNLAWAGAGAITAGARTSEYAGMTQVQIVQRCLSMRGYKVLA